MAASIKCLNCGRRIQVTPQAVRVDCQCGASMSRKPTVPETASPVPPSLAGPSAQGQPPVPAPGRPWQAPSSSRNELGWILAVALAAAGIGFPFLVIGAHTALDHETPATATAGTLLGIAALALPAAIGFPFLVDRRPGSMLLPAAIGGVFGGVWAIASFQEYGVPLAGFGLFLLFLYGGVVAGIGLLIAAILGAFHPSGPRPAMAVACGWAIAWGFCALAMLVTLQHQAAAAAYANRPRSSPGVGPLLAVGLLLAAAWRRR